MEQVFPSRNQYDITRTFKRFQNGIQYNMNGLFEYINKKIKNFTVLKQCVGIHFFSQFDHLGIKPSDLQIGINIRVDMKN